MSIWTAKVIEAGRPSHTTTLWATYTVSARTFLQAVRKVEALMKREGYPLKIQSIAATSGLEG